MKMRERKMRTLLAFSMMVLVFSGCIGQLPEEEKTWWFNIADPLAENILQSLNNDDYQQFIKDFSPEMVDGMPLEGFRSLKDLLQSKIGNYISKKPDDVVEKGGFINVIYSVKFEGEDNVTVRLVFIKGDETYQVQGLWFDSPRLREE